MKVELNGSVLHDPENMIKELDTGLFIQDAPHDDGVYFRRNGGWIQLNIHDIATLVAGKLKSCQCEQRGGECTEQATS